MPGWLGIGLAAAFTLITVHRGVRRDVPGALMAAGMAVMSVGMAGIGPTFVHGPWWAAGFLAVAVWPLVSPRLAGRVCGGPLAHLLGGVAMIYMCALPPMRADGSATALTANTVALAPTGHHHGMAMGPIGLPGMAQLGIPGPLGAALSVLGWGLACYFLLGTVTALTRRDAAGALTAPRLTVLGEAAMGFGTVIMLIAFT